MAKEFAEQNQSPEPTAEARRRSTTESDTRQELAVNTSTPPELAAEHHQSIASESKKNAPPLEARHDLPPPIEAGIREHDFRLLLPTSSAPLIVDVAIRVNGIPLQQAFDQEIARVLQNAAGDSNDRSWRRLFEHVSTNPIRFGNSSGIGRGDYRQATQRYDRNRSGTVEPRELTKLLFRTSSHSTPFRMFGTDAFRGSNKSKSTIFATLDTDRDGALDAHEIQSAAASLRDIDQNSDQRIDLSEVVRDAADADDAWKRSRSKRWGDVAMDLAGHVDWSMLSHMLGNLDRPGPFGQRRKLQAAIDLNNDRSIDADEAKQLLKVSPDIRLVVSYHNGGEATIRIDELAPELKTATETFESSRRLGVVGEAFTLIAQVTTWTGVSNQFSDQAFLTFDVNNDGGLDETEIPAPALREYAFANLDQNGDGKLTIKELREGFADKEPIWLIQVRARGAESPDAVFAWLDRNHDRFLSEREIRTAGSLMARFASDEGTLVPSAIPDTYLIQFGRGDPAQDAQLFGPASLIRDNRQDLRPKWAIAMDANRDGDISAGEFTGTREQFDGLDLNGDEFIDSTELEPP